MEVQMYYSCLRKNNHHVEYATPPAQICLDIFACNKNAADRSQRDNEMKQHQVSQTHGAWQSDCVVT
jgi:hypothetical protein